MKIILGIVLLIALMLRFLWLRIERKTVVTIEGCTVKLWRDRDFAWIVYREPSGRSLTLEAHDWRGPENQPQILVDFPAEVTFCDEESPRVKDGTTNLDIPVTPSSPISKEEATQVQERISKALTRLKIQHEFARPRRSGWTSFEDGKEIYHG